jgi:hypothetical protein
MILAADSSCDAGRRPAAAGVRSRLHAQATSIRSTSSPASSGCSISSFSQQVHSPARRSARHQRLAVGAMDQSGVKRLKASILVGQDNPEAAIAEIERCAKIGQYVRSTSRRAPTSRSAALHWPIYARAEELGLPLGIHVGGYGGHAPTAAGPSHYAEHQSNAHSSGGPPRHLIIRRRPAFLGGSRSCSSRRLRLISSTMWRMDQHL